MNFKTYFYLIFNLLLVSNYLFAQITPNGKSVSSSSYGDINSSTISAINYIVDNYYDVDIIQSSQANHGRFNCHFFAWNNTQGYGIWTQDYIWKNGQPSQLKWINYPTDYYTDQNYSQPSGYVSYVSTNNSVAEICVYTSNGIITHSARKLSYSSKLISKWGKMGIYKHDPYECPDGRWVWSSLWGWQLHDGYGTITAYYKINPNYRPVGNGDPGGRNWGTIISALVNIPYGSAITVLSGTQTLTGDISIPSGVTLTIKPDVTINYGNYAILLNGGSVIIESGVTNNYLFVKSGSTLKAVFGSVQAAVNYSSPSQTIELLPLTTYSDNITITSLDNRTLTGATNGTSVIDGNITLSNCTDFTLSNLKMHNGHSITINNSLDSETHSITFMGSGSINQYGCNSIATSGIVHNSASTSPAIYYYNTSGYTWGVDITDHDFGIWATSNTNMTVSTSTFCDNMLDLYANSGGYIYAPNNTMSAPWPQSIAGNVSGYSNNVCSKQLSKSDLLADGIEDNPLPEDINLLNTEYAKLLKKISDENEEKTPSVLLGYKADFDALIKDYKALLTVNSNSVETTAILSKIEKCYYATESQDEFEAYINTLLREKSSPYIERYFVNLNLNKGKYKEAVDICEKVLSTKGINEALICEMLYEEALIYKYSLSNTTKANELFAKLVKDYPDNGLYSFAAGELEQEGLEIPKSEGGNINQEEVIAKGFTVESYPNPFNPSTTINYSLPSDANVKVVIYDIMGRIVKTLASESKTSGSYQVTWDGTNSNGVRVTSGIYLYRFEAVSLENNKYFTKSAKLMLVK